MNSKPQIEHELLFADLVLNTRSFEVRQAKKHLQLPVLSFKLLQVLAENSPNTLTQERIIELVWEDNIVGDETLKQRVKLLRKSLGDNAQSPVYIGVVRGRGYHLIPNVTQKILQPVETPVFVLNERVPDLSSIEGMKIWKRMSIGLSFLILLLISVLYLFSLQLDKQENGLNQLIHQQPSEISQAYGYFLKGRDYYQRYRVEDNKIAIELYLHALALDPNLAIAHAGLADAYSQGVFQFGALEQWKKLALISANNAVRLDPNNEISHKALGLALYLNGSLKEAIDSNLTAIRINQKYLQANTNLAFIYREMGQIEKALEWNFKTINIDPFYAPGYLHLAQSYQAQGKFELANRNYIKALELKPDYQLAIDAYIKFNQRENQLHDFKL